MFFFKNHEVMMINNGQLLNRLSYCLNCLCFNTETIWLNLLSTINLMLNTEYYPLLFEWYINGTNNDINNYLYKRNRKTGVSYVTTRRNTSISLYLILIINFYSY